MKMIKGRIILDISRSEHTCINCRKAMTDEGKYCVTDFNGKNSFYCLKCFKRILEIELSNNINDKKRLQYEYLLKQIKLYSK